MGNFKFGDVLLLIVSVGGLLGIALLLYHLVRNVREGKGSAPAETFEQHDDPDQRAQNEEFDDHTTHGMSKKDILKHEKVTLVSPSHDVMIATSEIGIEASGRSSKRSEERKR